MDLKKSVNANVDKLRLPFIAVGFLFIGSLVLASFSYTASKVKDNKGGLDVDVADIKIEEVVKEEEDTPPPPPPQVDAPPPLQEEIKIEENTEDVPEAEVIVEEVEIQEAEEDIIEEVEAPILDYPDKDALFPGGAAEMMKWIQANMNYPQMAIANDDQGKVYVKFVVEKNGSISQVEIERGVSPELDKEAKRVIKRMPKWIPGEANAKAARTRCRIPIVFTLE